jgi:hypothetical protein
VALARKQAYAVVLPDGRNWVIVQGIEDSYCERLVHLGDHSFASPPIDRGGLLGRTWGTAEEFGAEDQGDDAHLHVLVDPGESNGLDGDPGFFLDFAAYAVLNRLVQFEDAAGQLPCTVVAALDHKDATVCVEDDGGDAD